MARDVAAGAVRRARDQLTGAEVQAPSGVTVFVVVFAVVVAALSLIAPPASLVVLVALGWLWLAPPARGQNMRAFASSGSAKGNRGSFT